LCEKRFLLMSITCRIYSEMPISTKDAAIMSSAREAIIADIQRRQRPVVDDLRGKHDSIRCTVHLAAHVELGLVALVAAERLEGGVLLEDVCKGLGLLYCDVVLEEIH
jgi:hypothetical protein